MPDTPAVTAILDEVEARMGNIATANGYNFTQKQIQRASLTPWRGIDLPAINIWATGTINERNAYGGDEREIALFIEMHELTRDEPFIDIAEKLAADGVTAINRATGAPAVSDDPSYDLGNTVMDVILFGYDYIIGEGGEPFCGVLLKFGVKYLTESMDMTNYNRE